MMTANSASEILRRVRRKSWLTSRLLGAASAVIVCSMPHSSARAAPETSAAHYTSPATQVSPEVQTAVSDIIARMNQSIDANDYNANAAFYSEDGFIDSGFGPLSRGRQAIIASLEQSAPFITNKRHVAGNVLINRADDRLVAGYYLTVFERVASLTLAGTAVITDSFEQRNGRWYVVSYVTRMDPATLKAMSAAMSASPH